MLLHVDFIRFAPSMCAATSVYYMRLLTASSDEIVWTRTLQHYTDYLQTDLHECCQILHKKHRSTKTHELRAVYDKFACPSTVKLPTSSLCLNYLFLVSRVCFLVKIANLWKVLLHFVFVLMVYENNKFIHLSLCTVCWCVFWKHTQRGPSFFLVYSFQIKINK